MSVPYPITSSRYCRAFTLVEMLVAVAVLALLMSIIMAIQLPKL